MTNIIDFNPVKEDKDGVRAKRVVWSSKSLEVAVKGLEMGKKLTANPFYENNTKLLKGDLVYQRTDEEVAEWVRCKNDIIYFVEKYCKLMTPEGIQHVTLRDYQVDYLRHLERNRLSIMLSARQAGKCLTFNGLIKIRIGDNYQIGDELNEYLIKNYYIEDGCYELPLFELYNLLDKSFKWKLKYNIYKLIYKIEHRKNKKHPKTIEFLYSILEKLNQHSEDKLLKSFNINDIDVWTDEGWSPITYIHQTKPFVVYNIQLENNLSLRCADEHILFKKGYKEVFVKDLRCGDFVMTEYGLKKVINITKEKHTLNMCDLTVNNTHHSYYTNHILSHNTTTSALFMLHYICFNVDKNALVLGNKRKTAVEILDKAKKIYIELPYFLRPGIYKWNEAEIVLDNGCRLMAEATTINSGISFTFHCVLADEFAHIHPNILDKFYNNLFPTITAGKARFMITSTQNGRNLFYRLYKAAEAGENEYKAFKVDWDQIPEWNPDKHCWEKRDENWRRLQIANYGSEEAFNAQFGTNFDISSNTLISQKFLQRYNKSVVEFVNKELPGVPHSECYYWNEKFDVSQLRNSYLIITCDLAEGLDKDYTVFSICRMIDPGDPKIECIGYFRSNTLNREEYTESLQYFLILHCNQNHVLLSFEKNTYGDMFYKLLVDNPDKISNLRDFDQSSIVKYYNDTGTRFTHGIKITAGNKSNHCKLFKEYFERGEIINPSFLMSVEIGNFNDTGTGHYKAIYGHDDMVMTMVQLAFVRDTLQYTLFLSEFNSLNVHDIKDDYLNNDYIYNPFETQSFVLQWEDDQYMTSEKRLNKL